MRPHLSPRPLLLLLLLTTAAFAALVAGCSGGPGASTTSGAPGSLSYHRDVKPLIDVKCAGCHVEGGIAPFALGSYAQVSGRGAAIKSATASGTMPPWPPAQGCSEYLDDRSLSADQIKLLGDWVDSGAPEGDPGDTPNPVAGTQATLSRTDLTLPMPVVYTPKISPDDYHCFLVDWPSTETTYVTGVGVKPGNPSIVHHVIAFLATPDEVAGYQKLDDAEPGPGWTCFGGPGGPFVVGKNSWVGAWAPGTLGSDFPPGTGIEIPAGSKIVMQVHYNTSKTAPAPDQSSILFKTDTSVTKKAIIMPWANPDWVTKKTMDIPAHAMDVTHSFAFDPTPYMSVITGGVIAANAPFTIYSAGLHMHTRGTRASSRILRKGGGDECMLDIDHWNFHWQGSYDFTQPKTFNPGDQLSLECHWNNPDPMAVNWGEGTGDEMCLGAFYATQ